jgi:hypothetical protein
MEHFDIPLDLPHAGTVALRIYRHLSRHAEAVPALDRARALCELFEPFRGTGTNPPQDEAEAVVAAGAQIARELVDQIEALSLRDDRLGQLVRNVFECLELGAEGATISLRAGEDPASPMRP